MTSFDLRPRSIFVCALVALLGLAYVEASAADPSAELRILSPANGDRIPRDIDPPLRADCQGVAISGLVPPGRWPYVAVQPLEANGRVWIQQRVLAVAPDGSFETTACLGTQTEGVLERFTIFALACSGRERFEGGEVLMGLPKDCAVSAPVTVLRSN